MKKALFLFACTLLATTVHAKVKVFDDSPRIVSLHEIPVEKIQELIHSKTSDFTVELREGTSFPLQFLVRNRFLSAMIDPNLVFKIEKTCYLRVVNKKCYMSEDLLQWEKASRFLEGKSTCEVSPSTNKAGFVLETNIVPYEELEEEEWD